MIQERQPDILTISSEVLKTGEAINSLDADARQKIVDGLAAVFLVAQSFVAGRWNKIAWDPVESKMIIGDSFETPDEVEDALRIYHGLINETLKVNSKGVLAKHFLRNGLFMLQSGIEDFRIFKKRRAAFKTETSATETVTELKTGNSNKHTPLWVDEG